MAKVFISYSKRDYIGIDGQVIMNNVIDKIAENLSDNDISYWIDREGLDIGITYAETIAKNIRGCETFLFISTENSNTSPWTLREISTAIEFGKTILPVKLDNSRYADSIALYLSSVQYIDFQEHGIEEGIRRIVSRLKGEEKDSNLRHFKKEKMAKLTSAILYSGVVFMTGTYACLTYQFLWAKSLRSSEIMGGLVGYACEFEILASIYYLIRILRQRRCVFALPACVVGVTFLAGMLMRDPEIMLCAVLTSLGWLLVLGGCFIRNSKGKNFFKIMSKEQTTLKMSDPENLIIVHLIIKAIIIVIAHYFGDSINNFIVSPLDLWRQFVTF